MSKRVRRVNPPEVKAEPEAPVKKPAPRKRAKPAPLEVKTEQAEPEAPVKKPAPRKRAKPVVNRLVDERAQIKKREEGDRYTGFNLGEPPTYIKYELNALYKAGQSDLVALLKAQTWKSWDILYFSLKNFDKARIHLQLSYEIVQNKVGAGAIGLNCRSCHRDTVQVNLLQTRSGDEGMTVYGKCSNCGVLDKY